MADLEEGHVNHGPSNLTLKDGSMTLVGVLEPPLHEGVKMAQAAHVFVLYTFEATDTWPAWSPETCP